MDKKTSNEVSVFLASFPSLQKMPKEYGTLDFWLGSLENSAKSRRVGRKSAEKRRRRQLEAAVGNRKNQVVV